LGPSSAAGWRGFLVAVACLGVLLAILGGELFTPSGGSLGALALLPVATAAWLLRRTGAIVVVAAALVIRVAGVRAGVDPLTAVAEIIMLLVAAVAIRVTAELIPRWRASLAQSQEQARILAVMTERERIGEELNSRTRQVLFTATLKLQAASSLTSNEEANARLRSALDDLDNLLSDLPREVFAPRR
jgi:signal transduction histidine kinase